MSPTTTGSREARARERAASSSSASTTRIPIIRRGRRAFDLDARVAELQLRHRRRRAARPDAISGRGGCATIVPRSNEESCICLTPILIPTPLRPFTGQAGHRRGRTAPPSARLLADADDDATAICARISYGDDGKLRSFVNVYRQRRRHPLSADAKPTPVEAGDTISIVPSVAGGVDAARRRPQTRAAELTHDEMQRYSRHLIMPEVGVEGQRKLKAARVLLRRRRRTRLARRAVSRRGRRRHARPRRLRRRRRQQPAAADPARHRRRRPLEARVGARSARRRSTRDVDDRRRTRRARRPTNALDIFTRLRRHRRRHRQLPDAVSRQRRVRAARQAERLRQHLPLRRTGVGVRDQGRPVLPLPLSRAAAARTRAELRRRRRARRAARASSARSRRPRRSS